jgi:hypothetical protein
VPGRTSTLAYHTTNVSGDAPQFHPFLPLRARARKGGYRAMLSVNLP